MNCGHQISIHIFSSCLNLKLLFPPRGCLSVNVALAAATFLKATWDTCDNFVSITFWSGQETYFLDFKQLIKRSSTK